jgi:hypothetical protein
MCTANCKIIDHFSAFESGLVAPFLYAAIIMQFAVFADDLMNCLTACDNCLDRNDLTRVFTHSFAVGNSDQQTATKQIELNAAAIRFFPSRFSSSLSLNRASFTLLPSFTSSSVRCSYAAAGWWRALPKTHLLFEFSLCLSPEPVLAKGSFLV